MADGHCVVQDSEIGGSRGSAKPSTSTCQAAPLLKHVGREVVFQGYSDTNTGDALRRISILTPGAAQAGLAPATGHVKMGRVGALGDNRNDPSYRQSVASIRIPRARSGLAVVI